MRQNPWTFPYWQPAGPRCQQDARVLGLGCRQVLTRSHVLPLEVNACVASPPDSSTKSTQTLESQSPAGPPLGTVQTLCASTDVLLLEMWHMGASAVETGTETSVFSEPHLERLSCIPPLKHNQPSCEASRWTEKYKNSHFCSALSSNTRLPYKNKYTKRNDLGGFFQLLEGPRCSHHCNTVKGRIPSTHSSVFTAYSHHPPANHLGSVCSAARITSAVPNGTRHGCFHQPDLKQNLHVSGWTHSTPFPRRGFERETNNFGQHNLSGLSLSQA